jgi:hypothetical protein
MNPPNPYQPNPGQSNLGWPQNQPGNYQQPNFPPPPNHFQGGFPPYNPFNPTGAPIDVPGATTAQVCGIIGIVLFASVIGLILNIVSIINGSRAMREAETFPGRYTESSVRRARTGKICGIVGLCLFAFAVLVILPVVLAANS